MSDHVPRQASVETVGHYVAQITSVIVNNPIEASKTLWAQRAIGASMIKLRKCVG
jgi:hypothetical protein